MQLALLSRPLSTAEGLVSTHVPSPRGAGGRVRVVPAASLSVQM